MRGLGTENTKLAGFKIISIEFFDAQLFGDIKYDFIDSEDFKDHLYTTVLIGHNGTLKSRLFGRIISLLQILYHLHTSDAKPSYTDTFRLIYSSNGKLYEFSNIIRAPVPSKLIAEKGFFMSIDGVAQVDFSNVGLPAAIIANAIMITDRFPFPNEDAFPIYHYLGSRYRPQLAGTKTYVGRVVEFVSRNIDSKFFIDGVRKIAAEFLPVGNAPCITYYTQNTQRFFKRDISQSQFYSYFEELDKKYKDTNKVPPFKLNHYKSKIKDDSHLAKKVFEYCELIRDSERLRSFDRLQVKALTFNLLKEEDIDYLRSEFEVLDHLRKLGIIYQAEIEFLTESELNLPDSGVEKSLDGYSIIESSSGEHNLFGSLIGILASTIENSIIFIDEPEISLHPNWQMRYVTFLTELLSDSKFASCHIFIATHSHFIISDLKGDYSAVVILKRDPMSNTLSAQLLRQTNTFGWSADEVLYSVFNVRSSRNSFFEYELNEMITLLNQNSRDYARIRQLYSKFSSLKFSEQDPLNIILEKIEIYLRKNA